jgi:hypothetical protein
LAADPTGAAIVCGTLHSLPRSKEVWAVAAAIFGLLGVIVGSVLQLLGQHFASRRDRRLDGQRKQILHQLLSDKDPWRRLETCQRVIGADQDYTKKLLIEIGARGSQGQRDVWALMSRKPLSGINEDD